MLLADIILPLALQGTLTYHIPSSLAGAVHVGSLVVVPVRRKHYTGVVVRLHEASGPNLPTDKTSSLRDIVSVSESTPLVLESQLRLWRWIAQYYMCAPGEVAKAALPAGLKVSGEALDKASARASRKTVSPTEGIEQEDVQMLLSPKQALPESLRHQLSPAQEIAAQAIQQCWSENEGQKPICLLHGVTSSGKTEVYTRLIQDTLERGEQVLFLVPEIALTTQLTTRLGKVFGDRMGIWHSKFTDKQRLTLWRRQLSPEAYPLILGVRSAVFLPFQKLGLIIVDEEHEQSYKQQDPAPRYNARDVATVLASLHCTGHPRGARVLLGSATPSLETYTHSQSGKYGYVPLTERYGGVEMPEILVEDMKELRRKRLLTSPFSPRLTELTRQTLKSGEQAILFQNRRGYSPVLTCHTCSWTPRCTRCDVSLTYHRPLSAASQSNGSMVCHYCGTSYPVPRQCPQCGDTELRDVGYGTEKIEAAARGIFPEARIQRMDLDTTRSRKSYEEIISSFQQGKKNLLIGTQMVTKGLDFGRVHVVGILNADQMLTQPDFRAYERSFQMLSQVAGRAGRRSGRGVVILQTGQPELPVIQHIVNNDYSSFYTHEIAERREYGYPPFVRLVYIYIKSPKDYLAETAARVLADMLRTHFPDTDLLGPERPFVSRVSLQYIRRILLKIQPVQSPLQVRALLQGARQYLSQMPDLKSVNIYFDVDPM